MRSENDLNNWISEFETWNKNVIQHARKISKTKASIIETLGDFTPIRVYPDVINEIHSLKLRVFDEKLKRLQAFLEESAS